MPAQQLNQFIINDLRVKFEQLFNRNQISNSLKQIHLDIRLLNENVNNRYIVNNNVNASFVNLSSSTNISSSLNKSALLTILNSSSNILSNSSSSTNNKLLIEFKIQFNSNDLDLELSASSIYLAVSSELIKLNESLFSNYNLDQSSLNVKEIYPAEDQLDKTIQNLLRLVLNSSTLVNRRLKRLQLIKLSRLNRTNQLELDELDYLQIDNNQTAVVAEEDDKTIKFRCEEDTKLTFCNQILTYKSVMWPNLMNHANLNELQTEFIYFREIIDSECFYLAKEFICLLLNPPCPTHYQTAAILPCGQLCSKFLNSCSNYIPTKIRDKFYSCQQLINLQDSILLFQNKTIDTTTKNKDASKASSDDSKNKQTNLNNYLTSSSEEVKSNYLKTNARITIESAVKNDNNTTNNDKQINSISVTSDVLNRNELLSNKISEMSFKNSQQKAEVENKNNHNNLANSVRTELEVNLTTDVLNDSSSIQSAITNSTYNQQNNCFNLDDLEQLNLSVKKFELVN